MKIRTQLLIGTALFAAVLLVIAASALATTAELDRLEQQADLAGRIGTGASDLDYMANQYLLYGEPQQLDRWEARHAELAADLANLSAGNTQEGALIAAIAGDRSRLESVFDDVAARANASGGVEDRGALQVAWSRVGVPSQALEYDAARLSALLGTEADAARFANTVQMTSLLGAFAAFVLVGVLVVGRRTLGSVAALQQGANVVGSGNLEHSIPVTSEDEIGDLARSFNRMAADLATVTASKADLEAEIERRTRAEAEVRSVALFPLQNPYPVLRTDRDGRLLYSNPAGAALLGDPEVGRPLPDPLCSAAREACAGGRERVIEQDFGPATYAIAVLPLPEHGYVNLYFADVTEQKRAEREVRELMASVQEEKERLSALIAGMPDEVWVADADGKVVLVNPPVLAEFGSDAFDRADVEAIAGRSEVYRPDGTPRPVEEAPPLRALAGEIVRNQEEIVRTPVRGELRYRQVNAVPMRDDAGTIVGSISVVRDITDQKRAESLLREREQTLQSILRAAPVGIGISSDRTIRSVNDHFCTMTGYAADELLGRGTRMLYPDDGEYARVGREKYGRIIEHGIGVVETRWRKKDGTVIEVLLSASPMDQQCPYENVVTVALDLTALREKEAALRQSEEKYRELFESMGEGFALHEIVLDDAGVPVDYRFLAMNPAFEAMTGIAANTAVGRLISELQPGLQPEWIERYGRVAITGEPEQFESFAEPLGRWFAVHAYSPGPGRFATVFADVTREREVAEALAESEAKYRHLFTHDITGDFIAAADGRVLDCNPAFARMFGFASVEAALSSSIAGTYVTPEDRAALLDRVRREGVVEYDERFRRRVDGTEIHVVENILGRFDDDGTLVETQGYIIEDTERHRAEEELRQSREWFRVMGEALPYGVWRANAHGGAEYVSQSFLDLLEMTQEEQREFGWTHRLPPDEVAPMLERWMRCVETGEDWDDEHHVLGPDGVYHTVLTRGRPVRDSDGAIVAWVGINLDIDDRKRSEEALREYAENLRRSNEDLERFAYVSSHDLQEPLRSIVSFSQLLERRYRGKLGQDADDYIEFIVEGGNRMQTLILDLLAFSRVNTTRQELRPTDTEEVLAAVERNLDLSLREAGAVLTHDPLPEVTADPLQLEQVFSNLVSNAVKFRRPEEPLRIHVSARRLDGFWEFSVKDNGIGIEEQYHDQIFVIFKRLHTKDRYPGTGIGLAIVKRIVDRHGGTIRVESTPGEGSTFLFTLPAA